MSHWFNSEIDRHELINSYKNQGSHETITLNNVNLKVKLFISTINIYVFYSLVFTESYEYVYLTQFNIKHHGKYY